MGISEHAWTFGDGTGANGCCPSHRYTRDGDYTVRLDVRTPDGRTASTSRVVQIRTHDVVVAKLTVPQSASSGQTRSITVGVSNTHYDERVQVELLKSGGGGWETVGTAVQLVPVRPANRTTSFAFSYTFTADDAARGKVTFRTVATLLGARDAQPADNEATALPTTVNR